jgi:drug/metabolite transporter (DMT)-like permease
MSPYVLSISVAIAANVVYHLLQKTIRPDVAAPASLVATYTVALAGSLFLLWMWPKTDTTFEALRRAGPTSYLLGLAIIGLEVGFLWAYRVGWDLSITAAYANVTVAIALVPVGVLAFGDRLDARRGIGLLLAVGGLWLLSARPAPSLGPPGVPSAPHAP